MAVEDFRTWLGHLDPHAHAGAVERAHALALDRDDPVTAARLLLEIEFDEDAEQLLVAEPTRIRGEDYMWLVAFRPAATRTWYDRKAMSCAGATMAGVEMPTFTSACTAARSPSMGAFDQLRGEAQDGDEADVVDGCGRRLEFVFFQPV